MVHADACSGAQAARLLHDLVPSARTSFLVNPSFPASARQINDAQEAARAIGVPVHVLRANSENEIDSAFQTVAIERIGALAVAGSPFFDTRRSRITALAARYGVPAMYQFRKYAVAGGLISYGIDIVDGHRQVGSYVGRILNGTKPGDFVPWRLLGRRPPCSGCDHLPQKHGRASRAEHAQRSRESSPESELAPWGLAPSE